MQWNLERFRSVITKLVLFIFEQKCIAKTVYITLVVNAFGSEECCSVESALCVDQENRAGVWKDQNKENKKISQSEQGIG
jgi:hypothetical protein